MLFIFVKNYKMSKLVGEIRMLRWGIVPNLPSFNISVDQVLGGIEKLFVTQIVREEFLDGIPSSVFQIVCCKKNKEGILLAPFVWKTYNRLPDEIQYFLPDEKHDYVKI